MLANGGLAARRAKRIHGCVFQTRVKVLVGSISVWFAGGRVKYSTPKNHAYGRLPPSSGGEAMPTSPAIG